MGKTELMGSHVMLFSQVSVQCVIACFIIKRIGDHFLPVMSTFVAESAGYRNHCCSTITSKYSKVTEQSLLEKLVKTLMSAVIIVDLRLVIEQTV